VRCSSIIVISVVISQGAQPFAEQLVNHPNVGGTTLVVAVSPYYFVIPSGL
jgi:hypothetical protein